MRCFPTLNGVHRPGLPPDCVIDPDRTRFDTTLFTMRSDCIVRRNTSMIEDRFSGEPFDKRDVQFDHP